MDWLFEGSNSKLDVPNRMFAGFLAFCLHISGGSRGDGAVECRIFPLNLLAAVDILAVWKPGLPY
jgi:hypothetical protein